MTDGVRLMPGSMRSAVIASLVLAAMALSQQARAAMFEPLGGGTAAPAADSGPPFQGLAEEILAGVEDLNVSAQLGSRLRVAVWPFTPEETPVPAPLANEYNAKLMAALIERAGHRYRFIAREALTAVARDISESGESEDHIQEVLAALVRDAQADVLVVGKLRPSSNEHVVLSYKAIEVRGGDLLAVTSHRTLHLPPAEARAARRAVTLDQALAAAARHLARQAPGLRALHMSGIRHQDSGLRTALSRYLEGRVGGALQVEMDGPFSRNTLVVTYPGRDGDDPTAPEDGDVPARTASLRSADLPAGHHGLRGSYWAFGDSIELLLSLRGRSGVVATWRARVHGGSLPDGLMPTPAIARATPKPPAMAEPAPAPRPLTGRAGAGPTSRQVVSAQEHLKALGYYPGWIDGAPGPRTDAAVRDYQRSAGLDVNGRVTEDLLDHLRRSRALGLHWARVAPVAPQPRPVASASGATAPSPVAVDRMIDGFLGADLGRKLDRRDKRNAAGAYMEACDVPLGREITWYNARSGNSGTVTPLREGVSATGDYCREFGQTVTVGGRTQRAFGVACQRPDGSWQIAGR